MKKIILSALLVTVALGGAFANFFPLGSTSATVTCNAAGSSCAATFGNTAYSIPASSPGETQSQLGHEVDLRDFARDL